MYDSHTVVSVIGPAYREEPNIEPPVRGVFETVEGSKVESPRMRCYDVEGVGP